MLVTLGGEMQLESKETCNLSELMLNNAESFYDFRRSIKFAYLYSKTVTILSEFVADTEQRETMLRNRRIGLSVTGVAQFIEDKSITQLINWLDNGYNEVKRYDDVYSEWFGIPKSVKMTCVKPSGSVSLLSGSTPGCHFPISEYYIRRVRINEDSPILQSVINAGYYVEDDLYSQYTKVVEIPVYSKCQTTESELSIYQQLELAALLQKYWVDNSVSITVKFDKEKTTKKEIDIALQYYQHRLKSVSFLPNIDEGQYEQVPYEEITQDEYNSLIKNIEPIDLSMLSQNSHEIDELYCSTDSCEIKSFTN